MGCAAIPPGLVNARSVEIRRPVRSGIGGDISSKTLVYSDLVGVHETRHRLVRLPDDREVTTSGRISIAAQDADGDNLIPVVGDLLRFTNDVAEVVGDREIVTRRLLSSGGAPTLWSLELGP